MTPEHETTIEIAGRMAQELQDLIGDAQKAGSDLPATRTLVEEWETHYQTINPWQNQLANQGDDTDIAALNDRTGQGGYWDCKYQGRCDCDDYCRDKEPYETPRLT